MDQGRETGAAVVPGIERRIKPFDHGPQGAQVNPRFGLRLGQQPDGALEHLGDQVVCVNQSGRTSGIRHQIFIVPELVTTPGPMPVGRLAAAHADERAPGRLDLLRDRHEIAVAAHNQHRANMAEAADVLDRIKAEPDVGPIFGRDSRREKLNQLNRALQQSIAVAAKKLPVAIGAVDGDGAIGASQLDDRLHINQRLLQLEAPVGLAVGAFAEPRFGQARMKVFKVPVERHRAG